MSLKFHETTFNWPDLLDDVKMQKWTGKECCNVN